MKERIAIVEGIRTPCCKSGGVFKDIEADDLGAYPVKELLVRTGIKPEEVDELIFGNAVQPATAANLARVVAMKAGLPASCPAYTVQRNCASGMEALSQAAYKLLLGEGEIYVAGSTEAMSHIAFLYSNKMKEFFTHLFRAKTLGQKLSTLASFRPSFLKPLIGIQEGLTDNISGMIMGMTAEVLAKEFSINRERQDRYALLSHQKAAAAREAGRLAEEIVPLPVAPDYKVCQTEDDGIRPQQSLEALAKLKPIFDRVEGTVTPGNACQVTDGAGAVLMMKESKAKAMGFEPLGYLKDHAYAALDPTRMGLGPVFATKKLLEKTGLSMKDFELIELNEAFAVQVLACMEAASSKAFAQRELGQADALGEINPDILNVNGGAIALGHPVGFTGTRIVLTLLKELKRQNKQMGLATLCVGGGQGAAFALEVS